MATTFLNNSVQQNVVDAHHVPPLRDSVKTAVEKYFTHLDGQQITDLYEMVLSEVEEPLFQTLMRITGGNQSLAAKILGLSRGTLRKKLEQYDLM
ncbi:MAG: DNA-binding transcriptional regulator Fis [Legionellales bacterium]|jgi:Fis family transcriptional regulator